jgi:DNA-binding transcriptional MerR regulator
VFETLFRVPAPAGAGTLDLCHSIYVIGKAHLSTDPAAAAGKLDDEDYPAYTMGRAADMIGVSQGFLRAVEAGRLFDATRSEGGHRRYSRYQLRLAARVREITDQGTPVDAACRIVILEDQLHEAVALNERYERDARQAPTDRE